MKKRKYPLYEVEKFENFRKMLDKAEESSADKTAFVYRKENKIKETDYKSFNADTKALGTALAALGMDGVHIAMVGENSYEWITVYMTVLAGKGVFVPVDRELPFEEIVDLLKESDTRIVFYSAAFEEKMRGAVQELPFVEYFVNVDKREDAEAGEFISLSGLLRHGAELCRVGDKSYTDAPCDMGKLKMLVYTSGTMGNPKGVMLSGRNLMSDVENGLELVCAGQRILSVLPFHYTYESVCNILSSVYCRKTVFINDSPRALMKNFKTFCPDRIFIVPEVAEIFYNRIWKKAEATGSADMLRRLLKVNKALRRMGIDNGAKLFRSIKRAFGGELKCIICGGAPVRPEVAEFFRDIGIEFLNGYGITECSPLVSVNRERSGDPSSVGVILPCLDVKIEGANKEGEGEICLRGDNVMMGYYKNDIATESVFEEGGWFHTGDIGMIGPQKQLFIKGRKKNVIVLQSGKNVYPEEIERYLTGIDLIEEAVVFANKNEAGNELSLGAEVYLNENALAGVSREERCARVKSEIDDLNRRLSPYKNIKNVKIRSTPFDKTATHKIKRAK